MAKKIINIGRTANDRGGDPLRTAFEKVNDNFTELYNATGLAGVDRLTNGNLAVILDNQGTLTTPLLFPVSFTAICDSAHMVNPVGFADNTWWQFDVQFQVNPNSTIQTMMNNIFPILTNPGYVSGYTFRFTEADHGIANYTFDITLNDVTYPGGAGWTSNVAVTQPPDYPSTINSLGAIKITANDKSIVFGTNGKLILPVGGDILDSTGTSVLHNIDGGDASTAF